MSEKNDEFKSDIIEFRNKIKQFREKLVDELLDKDEKNTKRQNEDMLELAEQEFDELIIFLDKFHDKFFIDVYKTKESIQFEIREFANDIKKIRQELKDQRKQLKIENVTVKSKNVLKFLEKKFKKMGKKLKSKIDWDSDLDLLDDLK
jgi:hypothetical protein